MLRKLIIALAAIAAIGIAAVPTDSLARGGHGGGHGGWHGGGGGWRGGGYYGGPYVYGYYPYSGVPYTCWRTVRVATPYGWRLRRVWVCG
jgi:hypothetical protein